RAMAQRDPLVEYQREGFGLFQSMMGQIREESVGFLFNLEVEVSGGEGRAAVAAKGLGAPQTPQAALSYSAPSADGGVEVRNQRGQLEQAATAKAQAAQQQRVSATFMGQNQAQQQAQQGERGAFGQRQGPPSGPAAPAQNRAQRRAQGKKKGR